MSDALDVFLSASSPQDYGEIGGVEYLFQSAVETDRLTEVLSRFPREKDVNRFIEDSVLSYEPLSTGWLDDLLQEVGELVRQLTGGEVEAPTIATAGEVNYDTDEMFALRAVLFDVIWDYFDTQTVDAERAFLVDFFYGIDFTHWTKWAVLLLYTDLDLRLPTVLNARRNSVDFAIDGKKLVYSLHSEKTQDAAS